MSRQFAVHFGASMGYDNRLIAYDNWDKLTNIAWVI